LPSAFSAFLASFQYSLVLKEGYNCRSTVSVSPNHVKVSILTRPEGRVQRFPELRMAQAVDVSILTRPEGRVQPAIISSHRVAGPVSILTRPEGRVQHVCALRAITAPGVSILTRPEGRVQLARAVAVLKAALQFQSSPVPKDGCNGSEGAAGQAAEVGFNPHPSRRTGATGQVRLMDVPVQFQSSPVPKDGCNHSGSVCMVRWYRVSILTRPEGRVQLCHAQHHAHQHQVSILTRPEGRVQRT